MGLVNQVEIQIRGNFLMGGGGGLLFFWRLILDILGCFCCGRLFLLSLLSELEAAVYTPEEAETDRALSSWSIVLISTSTAYTTEIFFGVYHQMLHVLQCFRLYDLSV